MPHKYKTLCARINIRVALYGLFFLVSLIFSAHQGLKTPHPEDLSEPGSFFIPFRKHLTSSPEAGYLTNKDMSPEKNDGLFLMAQYQLAPTILQINTIHPQWNILDYSSPAYVVFTLRKLHAAPVQTSPFGIILTERP